MLALLFIPGFSLCFALIYTQLAERSVLAGLLQDPRVKTLLDTVDEHKLRTTKENCQRRQSAYGVCVGEGRPVSSL